MRSNNVKPDFEIESKYHLEFVSCFLTTHILSLQDVYIRSMFFLVFRKIVSLLEKVFTGKNKLEAFESGQSVRVNKLLDVSSKGPLSRISSFSTKFVEESFV